jgi:hypothetical protein
MGEVCASRSRLRQSGGGASAEAGFSTVQSYERNPVVRWTCTKKYWVIHQL